MNGPLTDTPQGSAPGRVAGIDYGTVRLGIALADEETGIASPFATYTRLSPEADAVYLRRLVAEEGVDRFVVGLPVHLDGRESQKSREARRFARWLHEVAGRPVELFDERFTTAEAERILSEAGLSHKKRKQRRDMLAAQAILSAYLESTLRGDASAAPLDE